MGFWAPYFCKFAVIGCIGLAGYLFTLLWIRDNIEQRVAHRSATAKIRMLGVVLALTTLLVVPHVLALVGNLLLGSALTSQIDFLLN